MKTFIYFLVICLAANSPYLVLAGELPSAKMIPTATVVDEMSRAETQEKIEKTLSRPELRDKLAKLGLSQNEISKRLATLSDSELRQLASQVEQARYAGDLGGILIIVVLVLLIIFLAKRI